MSYAQIKNYFEKINSKTMSSNSKFNSKIPSLSSNSNTIYIFNYDICSNK